VKTNKPTAWWRLHQVAAIGLYLTACSAAWLLKEWASSTTALWAFVLIGAFAAINGVVRGHLLFTERTAPGRLPWNTANHDGSCLRWIWPSLPRLSSLPASWPTHGLSQPFL
jgi:hypothetical protein